MAIFGDRITKKPIETEIEIMDRHALAVGEMRSLVALLKCSARRDLLYISCRALGLWKVSWEECHRYPYSK
jgi:hypothetical protein